MLLISSQSSGGFSKVLDDMCAHVGLLLETVVYLWSVDIPQFNVDPALNQHLSACMLGRLSGMLTS